MAAERANGKSVAQIIKERLDAGDYYSRCPDTALHLDDTCKFSDAMGKLAGDAAAEQRVGAAVRQCTEYQQVTINRCVGQVSQAVDGELQRLYDESLIAARAADAAKVAGCEAGAEIACGGGMHHAKTLAASQASWSSYVDSQCAYQTEGNVGGSGYASFGMICWLELAASRIDQLTETKPYVVEAAL